MDDYDHGCPRTKAALSCAVADVELRTEAAHTGFVRATPGLGALEGAAAVVRMTSGRGYMNGLAGLLFGAGIYPGLGRLYFISCCYTAR